MTAASDAPGRRKALAPQRRRGAELENALLDAAWEELIAVGYSKFTMEGVASRAGTSRAVLYRRWANRRELALDAARRQRALSPISVPDTGSVRGDLLELLRMMMRYRAEQIAILTMMMADLTEDSAMTPARLRERFLAGTGNSMDVILGRGVERGEVDPARLTPGIASIPSDLMRHDMIMTQETVPETRLVEIVDDIFLPLIRPV